jgi:hypothetical protein
MVVLDRRILALGVTRSRSARAPDSLAGGSSAARASRLAGRWVLMRCGVGAWGGAGESFRPLLAAAGGAWSVAELNNPGAVRGLCSRRPAGYAGLPPSSRTRRSRYPDGGAAAAPRRARAYNGTLLVLGLLPALTFDPGRQGCTTCPGNCSPSRAHVHRRAAGHAGLVSASLGAALAVLALVECRSSRRARRCAAAGAAAGAVLPRWSRSTTPTALARLPLQRRRSTMPVARAGGDARPARARVRVGLGARAQRGTRSRGCDRAGRPAGGGSSGALAGALGDPRSSSRTRSRRILVDAHGPSGRIADAPGRAVSRSSARRPPSRDPTASGSSSTTPGLLEESRPAGGWHSPPRAVAAQARARLEQLRASRARTVERRRRAPRSSATPRRAQHGTWCFVRAAVAASDESATGRPAIAD